MREKEEKKKGARACMFCSFVFSKNKSLCPSCKMFNTDGAIAGGDDGTQLLSDADDKPLVTIPTGPWDKCFCNQTNTPHGIVHTSVTLLGGVPGAGKSTIGLQLGAALIRYYKMNEEVLYIAKEEDTDEVRSRAKRLDLAEVFSKMRVYGIKTNSDLGAVMLTRRPKGIIVDSLPGLIDDLDAAADFCKTMKEYAVELVAPVIVIDHVNKERDFAGLMELQHNVDTLLTLGPIEDGSPIRSLAGKKNRFGALAEVLLLMTEQGLVEYQEEEDEDE